MPLLANAANTMRINDRRLETVAQNLANVETPGFRRMMLVEREQGVAAHVVTRPGSLTQSDNPLDVAVSGDAFLVVVGADGQQGLTRNGHLSRGADGTLQSGGLTVMGEEGPVRVARGPVELRPDGTVWQDDNQVAKVRLVASPGGARLVPAGNGVYLTPDALRPSADGKLEIGALEGANVDQLREVTTMMTCLRAFEMSQKIALTDSETRKKLTDEVGRSR